MGKHKKSKKSKKYSSSDEEVWVEKETVNEIQKQQSKRTEKKRHYSSSSTDSSSSEDRKERKHKHKRKKNKYKRKSSESDDSSDSDHSERHFKDKRNQSSENPKCPSNQESDKEQIGSDIKRDDWMNIQSKFLTCSNANRKREKDEQKRLEREKQQYDPRNCDRELNPYWKHGGDGLPKFKKPDDSDNETQSYSNPNRYNRDSGWRKKKDMNEPQSRKEVSDSTPSDGKRQKHVQDKDTYTNIHPVNNERKDAAQEIDKNVHPVNNERKDATQEMEYTEKDLNALAAKLVKAEIMGNAKLVDELKAKLEIARKSVKPASAEEVILTQTDSRGQSKPVRLQSEYGETSQGRRKKKTETHRNNERVRYFADDDKHSLKEMFEHEKYSTGADQDKEFLKSFSKVPKNDDLDDIFSDNIRQKESDAKIDEKNKSKAINDHQKVTKSLENCSRCLQSENMLKHLMVSMGETSYLSLPSVEPLTSGHCFIIPIKHTPCATLLDENEWSDILDIRKSLVRMFSAQNEVVIFFECAMSLHNFPHMVIECIPMPIEEGDMAPIYFKKAIDESEIEWAQNKKLVSLKGRDVRKAIPKGLAYFSVSFGMEEGFAHVIEDEQLFPRNFAQEIIGGMLDLHHSKWRKPTRQKFEEQSKRVMEFSAKWKDFDCLGTY